jgi:hypothetical protein
MMFDLAICLDVAFLLFAIYLFPGVPPASESSTQQSQQDLHSLPSPLKARDDTPLPSPLPQGHNTAVPRIVLHPSHASSSAIPVSLTARPKSNHRTKSVSFSLSSMNDLLIGSAESQQEVRQHRPPTPWMRGPVSPSEIQGLIAHGEVSLMPIPVGVTVTQDRQGHRNQGGSGSLAVMVQEPEEAEKGEDVPLLSPKICNRDVVDTMGIKKSWLMS